MSKPERKARKQDEKSRSKGRVEDLPVKGKQAAAVKGGAGAKDVMKGLVSNHNETLVRAYPSRPVV